MSQKSNTTPQEVSSLMVDAKLAELLEDEGALSEMSKSLGSINNSLDSMIVGTEIMSVKLDAMLTKADAVDYLVAELGSKLSESSVEPVQPEVKVSWFKRTFTKLFNKN